MIKNFYKTSFSKIILGVVLPLLCMAAAVPAFAQSAEIRSAGVYYIDTASTSVDTATITQKYCAWTGKAINSAETGNNNINKSAITNAGGRSSNDPWHTSALIEYDQPYPAPNAGNYYPNHCLALCFDVYCTNKPNGSTTYSISFPLQSVRFEIAKYYGSKDILNPDNSPAVRTINKSLLDNKILNQNDTNTGALSTDLSDYMCAAYSCMGASSDYETSNTCPNPEYECIKVPTTGSCPNGNTSGYCCRKLTNTSAPFLVGASATICGTNGTSPNRVESKCIVRADGTGKGYNEPIRFCASWDGSYEILGEFGKTNGQFGFRANVRTEYPGDGIAVENISIDDNFAYPANNQYPIQVDVTNVHTVRTTPTVMGAITSVAAAPYTFAYRLSKDSDVRIRIYDAAANTCGANNSGWTTDTEASCTGGTKEWGFDAATGKERCCSQAISGLKVVRDLVDWQPRLGEGFKGADNDAAIIMESDSWDGRDDEGRLLPAGNYLVSIQAKSQDEWPGTDLSRAVTRQVSLDPLKLTDITTVALNKQSTAYATLNYVPTESSRVYFEIYSPGTTFESLYTDSSAKTGTSPSTATLTSVRVYRNDQERARGLSYAERWDGLCHELSGCKITYPEGSKHPVTGEILTAATEVPFAYGAPLPDGDYIYALWAEIPYTELYHNALGSTFTAVKTQLYYTGILPVDRGVVDITVQPVSYSTVGSSPAAYGLDPFIFKYSTAREAVVKAYVKNTAGLTVKTLTTGDGANNTSVAQQMNTLTWDGRDDAGRMVGPGTYMFVVEASDPMFPNAMKTQASTIFPVDLYRITDLTTTDVYGDNAAKATISYMLSKAMNVQIDIYNKDVVIPLQTSNKSEPTVTVEANTNNVVGNAKLPGLTNGALPATVTDTAITPAVADDQVGSTYYVYTDPTVTAGKYTYYRALKNVTAVDTTNNTETYTVTEVLKYEYTPTTWPPRVCNYTDDKAYMKNAAGTACTANTGCHVDPSVTPKPQCIYVNDPLFTNYPANANVAKYNYIEGGSQTLDVRLQPIKTFNRSALNAGDGIRLTEEWDAQYFYNPTPVSIADGGKNTVEAVAACKDQTDLKACPYEMVPDGTYPFYVAAQTNEPMSIYYSTTTAEPLRYSSDTIAQTGLFATDKWVYRLNVSRGPVYFLDGSVDVYPNAPQLFNTSSGPVFVPPYEINFSISRAATVEVAIIGLKDGMCTVSNRAVPNGDPAQQGTAYDATTWTYNKAGEVCKYLSTMTIPNTANFDPNITRRIYWDGTDNNGRYVKNGNYEIRLTAKNYPDEYLYQPTVKQLTRNIDILKVFDLPDAEAYAINKRGTDMNISYQISVPMKVALQIFKPGTTIYDYTKGTLRDPATGLEVTDVRDVLVKAIVGIRPATTLIEELWDGTDYANQYVADGTYPFRFVTALNGADVDSITGEILGGDDSAGSTDLKINHVADTNQYVNLHHATVAIGDGEFVCEDWERTVFFYPNPFNKPTGTLEVTKMPVPGTMTLKIFNLAGDLVREGGYTCVDAQNVYVNMGTSLNFSPDNTLHNTKGNETLNTGVFDDTQAAIAGAHRSVRNAALRCFWDKKNDHGKTVARGVYFGLVDFRAQNGRQHCQKVVRILIPR